MTEVGTADTTSAGESAPRGLVGRLDATGVPTLLARLAVGAVFIVHGLKKVSDPIAFHRALKGYDILPLDPPLIINATAVILPWIEVTVGALLILGLARRAAGLLTFGMLSVFTVAIFLLALDYLSKNPGIGFLDIPPIDCGCGGGEDAKIRPVNKIAQNLGLVLLSGWVMLSRSRRFSVRFRGG